MLTSACQLGNKDCAIFMVIFPNMGTVERSRKNENIKATKEIIAGFIINVNLILLTADSVYLSSSCSKPSLEYISVILLLTGSFCSFIISELIIYTSCLN